MVRCHYLRDGTAKFAFTVGRAEFFIPVGILLKCFVEASDKEVFTKLLAAIPQDEGEPSSLRRLLNIVLALFLMSKAGQAICRGGMGCCCGAGPLHAAGEVDNAIVETVERLLQAPSQMGLYTRVQSLEYLGSMFRGTLNVPARFTDLQVGTDGTLVGLLVHLYGHHCPKATRGAPRAGTSPRPQACL